MEELRKHEQFELQVLDRMNSSRLLEPLVFGGGTMLRLCYGLDRYSVDLDFWFIKDIEEGKYIEKLAACLEKSSEITDKHIKHKTALVEIRAAGFPKRLKIEIRRAMQKCDWERRIAYSQNHDIQVILKVHTLEHTMKKKIRAALDRKEIRDCYDIEFLLKKGVKLPDDKRDLTKLKELVTSFDVKDYKVVLGSLLEPKERQFYIENGFAIFMNAIESKINTSD